MKNFLFAVIAFSILSTELPAALPPFFQTLAEYKAIIEDDQLGQIIPSGEPILLIKKTDKGYLVITNKHVLPVRVNYQKADMPGPAKFQIEFLELRAKQED